jgi:hypothetical protein
MSRGLLLIMSLSLVGLVACGVQLNKEQAPLTTQQHFDRWLSTSQNYEITFQQKCFCLPEYLRSMRLTVQNNTVASAIFVDDSSPVPASMLKNLPTVEKVFETVIEAESQPAEIIRIMFHRRHNYPTKVFIDYDTKIADEEIQWQLSNLSLTTN